MINSKSKMNPKQQRYLTDRMETAWRTKYGWSSPNTVEKPPATVIEARKRIAKDQRIVSRWEDSQRDKKNKREADAKVAKRAVMETILFGDPQAALRAVAKFEEAK